MKEGEISCTIGKNNLLYVFKVIDGRKRRVSNIEGILCKNLPFCIKKNPCDNKINTPCKKQNTIFNSKSTIKEYCQLLENRPKGEYKKSERKKIANKANKELYHGISISKGKQKKKKTKKRKYRKVKFS